MERRIFTSGSWLISAWIHLICIVSRKGVKLTYVKILGTWIRHQSQTVLKDKMAISILWLQLMRSKFSCYARTFIEAKVPTYFVKQLKVKISKLSYKSCEPADMNFLSYWFVIESRCCWTFQLFVPAPNFFPYNNLHFSQFNDGLFKTWMLESEI